MSELKVAKRYAKSLLDLGKEHQVADQLNLDMKLVLSTLKANRQLALFFKSPIINGDKKNAVINEIFGGKIHKMALSFFEIIIRKKREYYIEDIATAFTELYKVFMHQQTAWLVTAVPADEDIRKKMLDLISKTTKDKVELKEKVDPSIIGGFILRWGDNQIDTSVTKKLLELKQDFRENLYQKDY